MPRAEAIRRLRKWVKQAFPVNDHNIIVFGGALSKPWPRKDVDVMVVLEDLEWLDSLPKGRFQKLIWETGEKLWRLTERRVAGDLWVYIPERLQLWHKGYHLDGYAKDVFCNKELSKQIFSHVETILKARGIFPHQIDDQRLSNRQMQREV